MNTCRELIGVIPVLHTAFNADGSIDEQGQMNLVNFLVEKNVGGFWALGTGSEDMNLTFDKRLQVARTISKANANRKPLILGCGFYCMEDTLNFIDATSNLDIDAYHVMPYHPLLSQDRLYWYYKKIADYAQKPLWLYTSANWSVQLALDTVKKLKDHPNIVGIKYSASHTVDQLKMIRLSDEIFQVITAVANQFYLCLSAGVKASTTSLASALPELLFDIYNPFINGDHSTALINQQKLISFMDQWPKLIKKDNFLAAAQEKYILSLRGVCKPYVSSYYRELQDEEKSRLIEALEKYELSYILEKEVI